MNRTGKPIKCALSLTMSLMFLMSSSVLSSFNGNISLSSNRVGAQRAPLAFSSDGDRASDPSDSIKELPGAASFAQFHTSQAYGELPLSFEANQGQADPQVRFTSGGSGYRLFLTSTEAVLVFSNVRSELKEEKVLDRNQKSKIREHKPAVLRMKMVGANRSAKVCGLGQLPGKSNYLIGNDPAKWRTDIPNYAEVQYENVYPGINLLYHGDQQGLEYDFVVAAGGNADVIRLAFEGARSMHLDVRGDLLMDTTAGAIRHHKPYAYQEVDGIKKEVPCQFVKKGPREVGFEVADYDVSKPLVIDPVVPSLGFSTYLGGSGVDMGIGIALDSIGNAYVTGETFSADFPTTSGAYDRSYNGSNDVFVLKLSSAGGLIYSTFLGGSGNDRGHAIAVASDNTAYVTGQTYSTNFPVTTGVWDTTHNGAADVYITRLSNTGAGPLFSTFLGGSNVDLAYGIAVDSSFTAYVTGLTTSTNFPTTALAFQKTFGGVQDSFVTKIAGGGYAIYYSTYLGGNGSDKGGEVATDTSGRAYVVGSTSSTNFPTALTGFGTRLSGTSDAFVSLLSSDGKTLEFSAYLGGNDADDGIRVVVPFANTFFVIGFTSSTDFPGVTSGNLRGPTDAFMSRITVGSIDKSIYLGGNGVDKGYGIAYSGGFIYLTGETNSNDFPTYNAYDSSYNGGRDAFVTVIEDNGSFTLRSSTFLGGSGDEDGRRIAASIYGVYVVGFTKSSNFPTTSGAISRTLKGTQDAFVTKLNQLN
jgi:hypothetical protein